MAYLQKHAKSSAKATKVKKVMGEFKRGTLKSGADGRKVKDPNQAIAIALAASLKKKK